MIFAIGAILGGLALCAAAFPRAGSRAEQLFRFAAGALLGLGISGALSMALRLAGLPAPWKDRALVVAGAAVLVAVRGRGLRLEAGVVRARTDRILAAAAAASALLVFALFVEHTLRYPDGGWDARAIWNLHARALGEGCAPPRSCPTKAGEARPQPPRPRGRQDPRTRSSTIARRVPRQPRRSGGNPRPGPRAPPPSYGRRKRSAARSGA